MKSEEYTYKVSEIFYSIEGEGTRAGYPCVFIRLFGCQLHCSYCDSRYSCDGNEYTVMSLEQILEQARSYDCARVTVTGGEPLIQKDIEKLLSSLSRYFEVNVETNGGVDIPTINTNIFYTMDYKSISSGMNEYMSINRIRALVDLSYNPLPNVLKFVVGSQEDLLGMKYVIEQLKEEYDYHIGNHIKFFVSPVFGKIEPKEIVEFLLKNKLNDVRMQLQIHKLVWAPEMRGV